MFSFLDRFLPTPYEKRMTALVTMIVLLVGVSLTARLVDEEQDLRQRASETTIPLNVPISENPPLDTTNTPPIVTVDPLATAITVSAILADTTTPLLTSRAFTLSVYDSSNTLIANETTPLIFQNGAYSGTANIGNLQSGTYLFRIRTPGFLENTLNTNLQQVTKGQLLTLPRITLIPGDINGDNVINTADYNDLTGCIDSSTSSSTCSQEKKEASDLNTDGAVTQLDYYIFLKNLK